MSLKPKRTMPSISAGIIPTPIQQQVQAESTCEEKQVVEAPDKIEDDEAIIDIFSTIEATKKAEREHMEKKKEIEAIFFEMDTAQTDLFSANKKQFGLLLALAKNKGRPEINEPINNSDLENHLITLQGETVLIEGRLLALKSEILSVLRSL